MFIISLTYKTDLAEIDKHLDAHVEYLKQEYAAWSFIASGRMIPRTGGVILSSLKDWDELEQILARDPFNQAGVADYNITEFVPSMVADGYEILRQ